MRPRRPRAGPSLILNYGLKYDDFERIIETVPTIRKVLPIREIRKGIRRYQYNLDGRVVGTTHDYAEFNLLEVDRGRFLTAADNEKYQNYAVLAHDRQDPLPLRRPGRPDGQARYRLLHGRRRDQERQSSAGIGASLAAQDFNKDVYIPLNTCRVRFGEKIVNPGQDRWRPRRPSSRRSPSRSASIDEVRPTVPIIKAAYEPCHPRKDVEMTVPYDLLVRPSRRPASSASSWARSPPSRSWSAASAS